MHNNFIRNICNSKRTFREVDKKTTVSAPKSGLFGQKSGDFFKFC